jgi:hypothetical protein
MSRVVRIISCSSSLMWASNQKILIVTSLLSWKDIILNFTGLEACICPRSLSRNHYTNFYSARFDFTKCQTIQNCVTVTVLSNVAIIFQGIQPTSLLLEKF